MKRCEWVIGLNVLPAVGILSLALAGGVRSFLEDRMGWYGDIFWWVATALMLGTLGFFGQGIVRRCGWAWRWSVVLAVLLLIGGSLTVLFMIPLTIGSYGKNGVRLLLHHPLVIWYFVGPALWLVYYLRPSIRAQFHG
jgi:hypothetical protein